MIGALTGKPDLSWTALGLIVFAGSSLVWIGCTLSEIREKRRRYASMTVITGTGAIERWVRVEESIEPGMFCSINPRTGHLHRYRADEGVQPVGVAVRWLVVGELVNLNDGVR